MLAAMSFPRSDLATSIPSIVPAIPPIPSEQPTGVHPAARPMESLAVELTQPVSDQSRKRCASELEEHRTVKAPKREPQDDIPLSLPINEVNHLPAAATAFAVPPAATQVVFPTMQPLIMSQSRPPSPTPSTAFATHSSFTTIKQQAPLAATFPTFAGPPSGAIHPLTLPQPTAVPSKPTTSVIRPSIGRISRSGSINGTTFKNPYASFPYQDGYSDPSAWHPKISSSSSRSNQSTWYMGSEPFHTLRKSSSDFVGSTSDSMSGASHNSSPTDDDYDEDESDSDESNGEKAVVHRVRVLFSG